MSYEVRFRRSFYESVYAIKEFIDSQGCLYDGQGAKVVDDLMRTIEKSSLSFSPRSYHLAYDARLRVAGVGQMLVTKKYKLFFLIMEDTRRVEVLDIRPSAENPERAIEAIISRL